MCRARRAESAGNWDFRWTNLRKLPQTPARKCSGKGAIARKGHNRIQGLLDRQKLVASSALGESAPAIRLQITTLTLFASDNYYAANNTNPQWAPAWRGK